MAISRCLKTTNYLNIIFGQQMAGMVTSQTRGNNFQTMVKKLKLVPDTEVLNPTEQNNPG